MGRARGGCKVKLVRVHEDTGDAIGAEIMGVGGDPDFEVFITLAPGGVADTFLEARVGAGLGSRTDCDEHFPL